MANGNNKQQVSEGYDFVVEKDTRAYGGPSAQTVFKADGKTGSVSLPLTLLQDAWDKDAADGAAATATAEHTFFRAPNSIKITAIAYVPDATLTASDTTYATLTVAQRNAAGASVNSSFAVVTTKTGASGGSGNWSAFTPVALALAGSAMSAGDILTIAIAKASTGVVVPAGQLVIYYSLV